MADYVRFAERAVFPFSTSGVNATSAPWIFVGSSYAGALGAWIEKTNPDVFHAYYASSAPVQVVSNYWQYFTPMIENMPRNCSRDLSAFITRVDKILLKGSEEQKIELKTHFGLEKLQDDDFAFVLHMGTWTWQSRDSMPFYSNFDRFCDYVEGKYNENLPRLPWAIGQQFTSSEKGDNLSRTLRGLSAWTKDVLIPGYCNYYGYKGHMTTDCLDSHDINHRQWKDITVGNQADRQWEWMLCNEPFEWRFR